MSELPDIPRDPMQAFQEKIVEKLRADIADMLPAEVLQKLVQRAVEEQFFKKDKVRNPNKCSYSDPEFIDGPSWFVREVAQVAKPLIDELVCSAVERNKAEIAKVVAEIVNAETLTLKINALMFDRMQISIGEHVMALLQQLRNQGIIR